MAESTENSIYPVLKCYPIRPDNSINLSAGALNKLKWAHGMECQIWIDEANNRIIIEPADAQDKPEAQAS